MLLYTISFMYDKLMYNIPCLYTYQLLYWSFTFISHGYLGIMVGCLFIYCAKRKCNSFTKKCFDTKANLFHKGCQPVNLY